MPVDSVVRVISPQGELTPFGMRPKDTLCRVVGIFESGFFDLDSTYAFASLATTQNLLGVGDVVNSIELEVDDLNRAPEIARDMEKVLPAGLAATNWQETNQLVLGALRMDKAVSVITISLIELVAGLNILITLIMMVMEKHKDIAILMSMGARIGQIRRIFVLQGMLIGLVGTVIGLTLGYTLSILANRYRWIRLSEEVYSMSFVPFEPRWTDGIWVAAVALAVSFLATLYPARSAAKIAPAESLRYE
jgi:lipoprotein-releasing system permease protein